MSTIKIRPLSRIGTRTLTGSYLDASGKAHYLVDNGRKVVSNIEDNQKAWNKVFTKGEEISIEVDTLKSKVVEFFKNHPLVQTKGYMNKNLTQPLFELEIKEEIVEAEYSTVTAKLEMIGRINTMEIAQMRELMYALGGNPTGMKPKEVYTSLIGTDFNGLALANVNHTAKFFELRSEEFEANIYAQKAIRLGVVTREGSVYKIADRNAGIDLNSVVATLLADGQLFTGFVKPECDKRESSAYGSKSEELPGIYPFGLYYTEKSAAEKKKSTAPAKEDSKSEAAAK